MWCDTWINKHPLSANNISKFVMHYFVSQAASEISDSFELKHKTKYFVKYHIKVTLSHYRDLPM